MKNKKKVGHPTKGISNRKDSSVQNSAVEIGKEVLGLYWFDWFIERADRGMIGGAGGPLPSPWGLLNSEEFRAPGGRTQGWPKQGDMWVGSLSPVDRHGAASLGLSSRFAVSQLGVLYRDSCSLWNMRADQGNCCWSLYTGPITWRYVEVMGSHCDRSREMEEFEDWTCAQKQAYQHYWKLWYEDVWPSPSFLVA